MRILVVGAGAVGGYFGGRLAEAGRDVTFLVRPAKAEQLRRDGLQIVSPHGDLNLTPKLILATEVTEPYDVVLLTVKAYGLEAVLDELAPAIGLETMILPVLNGMRHMDILAARFPKALIGGVCMVISQMDEAGRIIQLAPLQHLTYGELDGTETPRILALDRMMRNSGFNVRLSAKIVQGMWDKWVQLASLGAITCLMRGTIGDVASVPGGEQFELDILEECAAVATAHGYPLSDHIRTQLTQLVATPGSPMTSSMYRDMRAGNPVEADQIVGDLIARAKSHNLKMLLLNAAYINLSVYSNQQARSD